MLILGFSFGGDKKTKDFCSPEEVVSTERLQQISDNLSGEQSPGYAVVEQAVKDGKKVVVCTGCGASSIEDK